VKATAYPKEVAEPRTFVSYTNEAGTKTLGLASQYMLCVVSSGFVVVVVVRIATNQKVAVAGRCMDGALTLTLKVNASMLRCFDAPVLRCFDSLLKPSAMYNDGELVSRLPQRVQPRQLARKLQLRDSSNFELFLKSYLNYRQR
jgi:hypothetical protein